MLERRSGPLIGEPANRVPCSRFWSWNGALTISVGRREQLRRIASALIALGALLAPAALGLSCGSARSDRAGLAFTRYPTPERTSVWVADADGSDARQIVANGFLGALSSDGRWVAYFVARKAGAGLPTLFVRRVAGGAARRIGRASEYAWAPDSTRLAVGARTALLLVDAKSGRRRAPASGDVTWVSFAPDGKALVYAHGNGGVGREYRSDVFVARLAGGEPAQLTHDAHSDRPVWGRDWIAYRSFHFAGTWSIGRLGLMRRDGTEQRGFARGDERPTRPQLGLDPLAFSADGKRLLACAASEFDCAPVTFTVPDGRKNKLSVDAGGATFVQAWGLRPDGTEVLVEAGAFDDERHHRVYAIPFEGGKPRLIVRDATSPSWAY
jgi:hypothetical protein